MSTKTRAAESRETTSYTIETPEYGTLTFYGPGLTKPEPVTTVPNVFKDAADTPEETPKAAQAVAAAEPEKKPAAVPGQHIAARQYIHSLGLGDITDWDGESGIVSIGGAMLTPSFVSDGIAYAPKNQLDAAAQAYKLRAGLSTPREVEDAYSRRYDRARGDALKKLTEREAFSYSPETDPVYNAYRDHYTSAANAALARILNANNTSIYGASGAVLSEAFSARDAELRALDDKIPELYAAAFDRYTKETKRLRDNYSDVRSEANDAWERAAEASDTAWDRQRKEREDFYKEKARQSELETQEREQSMKERREALDAAARLLEMEGQKNKNRSYASDAAADEEYAAHYPEYLALLLKAQELKNKAAERELDKETQLRQVAREAYEKSYYAARGKVDGVLGIHRGG